MKKISFFLLSILLISSCAEEQDFDQVDELRIVPNVASSIFYLESDEQTINAAGTAIFFDEVFTFEAFSDANIAGRVLDGTITYQLENTTSKPFNFSIQFLSANGFVLDVETFFIDSEPTPMVEREVFYGDGGKSMDILVNTSNIRVIAENLGDTTSQSTQNDPKVILRSSAAFRVELR